MSGSKPACVKSALSAKELWWSAGCSAVSPTALAPPTVPASTAPMINAPGRKKAKPCRGGYRPSTLRSTGNGSPTVSASSRSFSRCTEFHKRPTATCCRLKKPKKAALNQGIFLPHLDNPGVFGRLRGGNAHNHLIFRGFSRCQKVATPKLFATVETSKAMEWYKSSMFMLVFCMLLKTCYDSKLAAVSIPPSAPFLSSQQTGFLIKGRAFLLGFRRLRLFSGSEVAGCHAALLQVFLVILFGAIESACRRDLRRDRALALATGIERCP